MKVFLVSFLAVALHASSVLAFGNRCESLFQPSDQFERSFRAEKYRQFLLRTIGGVIERQAAEDGFMFGPYKHQGFWRDAEYHAEANQAMFEAQIDRRNTIGVREIQDAAARSATLRRLKIDTAIVPTELLPPALHDQTLAAMKDSTLDKTTRTNVMLADEYFVWLKHNALKFAIEKPLRISAGVVDMLLMPRKVDPVSLYEIYRDRGYSVEVALLRVMRNLDPMMTAEAVRHADRAVFFARAEIIIRTQILPFLNRDIPGADAAWLATASATSLAFPSAKQGRESLQALLNQQARDFGHLFTRGAYERVLALNSQLRHEMTVINDYTVKKIRGESTESILRELTPRLIELRNALGLGRDLPLDVLYNAVERTKFLGQDGSYESVLAMVFAPETSKQIEVLRKIVEIGEAFRTQEGGAAYIGQLTRESKL